MYELLKFEPIVLEVSLGKYGRWWSYVVLPTPAGFKRSNAK